VFHAVIRNAQRITLTCRSLHLPFGWGAYPLADVYVCGALHDFDVLNSPSSSVYNACMSFRGQQGNPNAKRGRTPPPEDTFEEASFLKALGEKQKLVSVKLMDGQVVRGWIEYYDKNMVRLTREGAPNLFIFKHEIMYIAEENDKKK
jgi:host factor-I protein